MRIDELEVVAREAAEKLVDREGRPVPTAVVLPLPHATRVVTLAEFPDDDPSRFDLLHRFAQEEMRPVNAPCYAFVAEATVEAEGRPVDVVVVVYGARGQRPRLSAALLTPDGVGAWGQTEDLAAGAMPFVGPLQHAADAASPPDVMSAN